MPVDKAVLQRFIDEIPFAKAEDKAYFTSSLLADESAAVQFVGQRMRHDDYSTKTTELANKEKTLATKANDSVRAYATQLADAQNKIRDIMTQLENEQISATKSRALLAKVKTVYNLSDEDIPKIDDEGSVKKGQEGMLDRATVNQMLKDHEASLLKQLAPINSFPMIPVIVNEIQHEHQALTGQRLGEKEIRELMTLSSAENGRSLKQEWEEKYGIVGKREEGRFGERLKTERQKWDDEQKAANDAAALRGVARTSDGKFTSGATLSPVMGRKFGEHVDSTNSADVAARDTHAKTMQSSGPKPTGAERAAVKFMERRAAGIPMGEAVPVKTGTGA